jgi:predicted PurR-regulated permease PerM
MLRRAPSSSQGIPPESVIFILAALAFCAVAYSVHSILSPFVVVAAVIFLFYPFRKHEFVRRVLVASVLLVFLWGFSVLASLLTPFLIAYVLAYLFDPFVTWLGSRRVPRWAGSLFVVLCIVGALTGVALFAMPAIVGQIQVLLGSIQHLVVDTRDWLSSDAPAQLLARIGIPVERARELLTTHLVPRLEGILTSVISGILDVVTGASSLAVQILNIIIIPFVLFFLLLDFPAIGRKFVASFPAYRQHRVQATLSTIDEVLGQYVRGSVIVALIQGTVAAIGLWIIGVDSPLVLGVMTAFLDFIPYVGLITSLVVASIVAAFSGGAVSAKITAVVIMYLVQKLLEGTVLGPKIVGSKVGIHPVLMILSLMIFGYFLGFVGLLIAVPATALILVALGRWGIGGNA